MFIADEQADFNDPNGTIGLLNDRISTDQSGFGAFNFAKKSFNQHTLSLGLNLRQDTALQKDISLNEVKVNADRNTIVLSGSHNYTSSHNVVMTTVLRQNYYADTIKKNSANAFDMAKNISATSFAWQTGLKLPFKTYWSLLSNIGQTVRIPSMLEKFGNTGLYVGNVDLKEEQALIGDMGLQYQNNNLSIYSVIFGKDITNGIYTIYNSQGVGKPENIGSSKLFGNESNMSYRFTQAFTWSLNSTFMESENLSDIKAFKGKKLPGIYHINYGSAIHYQYKAIGLKASYQFYSDLYYNSANAVKADDKQELDISSTLYLEPITVDVSIRNVLDQHVMDYNRMPSAGRSYFLTITINI